MPSLEDEKKFIKERREEISLITSDPRLLDILEEKSGSAGLVDRKRTENVLEEFETKIYFLEKKEFAADAKRVAVEAAETQAFGLMMPIIERLKSDPRCRSICLLTDNVAGKKFEARHDQDFQKIDDHRDPMFSDIPGPWDVALAGVEPPNSPNSVLLFGAKSVFEAKKLYFISSGWLGVGDSGLFKGRRGSRMDKIDGFFCNDELAKKILLTQLRQVSPEIVYATGTPITDALELWRGAELREIGRKKLGLAEDEFALLYIGDISFGYRRLSYNTDEKINEKTFEKTLNALINLAERSPEIKLALLVRPHPGDPDKEELLAISQRKAPANLKIIRAAANDIPMQEAGFAADATASIISTENFLAALRGRKAIFLGYEDKGLGGYVLNKVYGSQALELIKNDSNLEIAATAEEFSSWAQKTAVSNRPAGKFSAGGASYSVKKILDKILA